MVTRGKAIDVLAYVAGVVDSDGHIGIDRSATMPQRRTSVRYEAAVVVTNVDRPLMDWLQEEFGGSLRQRKQMLPHHKPTYSWKLSEQQAAGFCEQILPYLRVKKRQAELLIELKAGWQQPEKRGQGAKTSESELARREAIYQRFKALNDDRRPHRPSESASRTDEAMVGPASKDAEVEGTETVYPAPVSA